MNISDLTPDPANPNRMSDEDKGRMARSLAEFGDLSGIIFNARSGVLVGGHQRTSVMDDGAVTITERLKKPDADGTTARGYITHMDRQYSYREVDWSEERAHAALLAANKFGRIGADDPAMLKDILEQLDTGDMDMDLTGFTEDAIALLMEQIHDESEITEDIPPDPPEHPNSERGRMYQLGAHRLMCGDTTDEKDVARLMDGEKATMLHADPPYGMGKEKDGIANDNLYREKLDAFQMAWWSAWRGKVADNGSAYIWGKAPDLWRLWYVGGLRDSERLTMRNEIVWDKGHGLGMSADVRLGYATATERCIFFMLGEQGFNNNADNYWEGWESVRAALAEDCDAMGWGAKDIERICGVGMHSHWFTKSQWSFIPEEHYKKLQHAAREHDAFKREHDDLKREFYATRAHFNNTHDNMTDVWQFPRVTGEERYCHATPKPVQMVARAIKSSSNDGCIVGVPFGGTCPEIIACEQTNRACRTMEIDPRYCDVIVRRYANLVGADADKIFKTGVHKAS